jgi:hypothetical protein
VTLDFAYPLSGSVQGHLSAHGLTPAKADYGERVRLVLEVPTERLDDFVDGLVERTARQVRVDITKA